MLLNYLKTNYKENSPIVFSNLNVYGMTQNNLRQQIKNLCDAGLLKRYSTGVYYLPQKSIFKSGSTLSVEQVINVKYIFSQNEVIGYYTGLSFANLIGATTQVPSVYDVATNKATNEYREVKIAASKVAVRKPRIKITSENYRLLQLLDFLKDADTLSEVDFSELKKIIVAYMAKAKITFDDLEKYLPLYPDKIFRNLYNIGLVYGFSS